MFSTKLFRWGLFLVLPMVAAGTVYQANPSNYNALLTVLQPGDTLVLAGGTYPLLSPSGLNGTPSAWITITGPASGSPAIIAGSACCNTVEISNCSYLAIENLTVNSQSIDGVFGISAHNGLSNITHDILIQNNILIGQDGSQETDGISTKTPTWNWTIRNNTITGAGTGLYLGNSDGTDPFIGGLIENNLIQNTIGYDMEIKYQVPRPTVIGMPTGPSTTIIRNNVFIKNDQPNPDGDRPNVLVGGFPASGPGSNDMYEIYGNFFYHNPRESLLQADGQVSIHDNVFVDGQYGAVGLFETDAPLNIAYVYNNTIYSTQAGIYFGSAATIADGVTGNLIFAATPIFGSSLIANLSNNIVDSFANAPLYVNAPSLTLGSMNFYPLTGQAQGPALNLSPFAAETDYGIDFNGTPKNALLGAIVFRGAYAGQGVNPGWQLQDAIKPLAAAGSLTAVTIQTSPTGLQFTVDGGAAQTAPQTLNLSQGGHTIAVATTQAGGAGTQYIFTSWSDGGQAAHSIIVGASPATYTASFQTQYQLTTAVSPLNGGAVTPASGAFYNSGSVVPVTATANSGYSFTSWTGPVASAGSASTTVTMSAPHTVTANFSLLTAITIQTSPVGLQFSLDGTVYTAPQTLNLAPGPHTLAVATTQAGSPGTEYVFISWSDGGAASHTITVSGTAATYTASFKTQYQLALSASPAAGGTFTPASGGFYDSGSVVPITATANSGYSFTSWTGPVASAGSASTTVTMVAPETVTANFTAVTGHPAFFAGEVALGSGVYYLQFPDGNLFGYYAYTGGGFIDHFDMGYEYVDPVSSGNGAYLWDYASGHWFYTNPSLFSYLYDFTLNAWIYYFPDTKNAGHYTTNPRYFANLATGQIFTM